MAIRSDGGPEFTVIVRALGATRMEAGSQLCFQMLNDQAGPREVTIRPFLLDQGFSVAIPRGVDIEIHGAAETFELAKSEFPAIGVGIANMLSLSCNAFTGDPRFLMCFDCTPGRPEREFYHQLRPLPTGMPPQGRRLDLDATGFLLVALVESAECDRIGRATGQYHTALSYWEPGYAILAMAHLFMAVEALTPAVRRQLCQKRGLDQAGLAGEFGIATTADGWQYALDGRIKSDVIFGGNADVYRAAKQASDGFEHGFMPFSDIKVRVSDDTKRVAADAVRSTILSLSCLADPWLATLLSGGYEHPLESWDVTYALGGTLLGDQAGALLHDIAHPRPELQMDDGILAARSAGAGQVSYKINPTIRVVSLPAGMTLSLSFNEIWGPTGPEVSEAGLVFDSASANPAEMDATDI